MAASEDASAKQAYCLSFISFTNSRGTDKNILKNTGRSDL
jgi:hypothetical protein